MIFPALCPTYVSLFDGQALKEAEIEFAVIFCSDPEHNNQQMIPGDENNLFFRMIVCGSLHQFYLHVLHLVLTDRSCSEVHCDITSAVKIIYSQDPQAVLT